jgi:hypothetical protein
MEKQYDYFSGYTKFNFKRYFSWALFWSIFLIGIIFLWIYLFNFFIAFIVALAIAAIIPLVIATNRTPKITTYLVNGKEYLLYNEYLFYQNLLKVDSNPLEIKNKWEPDGICFINEFLYDFVNCIKIGCDQAKEFLAIFTKIEIANVDYVFLERIYPTEKIIPLFKLISTLDHNTITNKDELIKSLEDFRTMVYQDQEKLSEERVKVITDDINRIQKSLHSIEGNMGYDTTLPDLDSDKEEQK